MPDTARRKEEMQRVQVGLTGLAGILLMVGLVNIVVEKVRNEDASSLTTVVPANATDATNASAQRNEPLAELGVTPVSEPSASVVEDLRPDPKLRTRMDQTTPQQQQR
ncbi:hypothetical protein [Sphingobium subterraneum]|uniref:Uncharacterized protein n=1 Tax=Sphingobium subterraneum TaxID=627688 RepID=A0A841IY59_9SPHN|nr:hypothetical protein [Sphingobium subterraneum]MBB6123593.1 hypothetical protein [Sphingobium subterraneum]